MKILAPLAWVYGNWVRRRNAHYDRPGTTERVAATVVSVGNLSAGGTGKTPLVGWLARQLIGRDVKTAIVSRGYGGSAGRGPVVVAAGDGPLCAASLCGDEPWMLAHSIAQTIVVVGSDRRAGARRAIELGARLILLDDGFQHRALARDLDIVLLDRTRPLDRDDLLPVGMLREPAASLARADWILITRSASPAGAENLLAAVRRANRDAPVLHTDHEPAGFFDPDGQSVPRPRRALVFCAIGNPTRFRQDLERLGLEIAGFTAYRDHRPISPPALRRLRKKAAEQEACLLTTEKDLARIGIEEARRNGLVTLRIEPRVADGDRLIEAIMGLVNNSPT